MYTKVVSSLLFPLHEQLKGHASVAKMHQLELSQWHTPEQLAQNQLLQLRQFLQNIQQHVPYYQNLFADLAFSPSQLTDLSGLQALPLLDKACIRQAGDSLKSNLAKDLTLFNTGGSSGQPLQFFVGKERKSHDIAAKWRATKWWDVDIGDKELVVWGSPIELSKQDKVKRWRDRLLRSQLLPAFAMAEADLARYVATIKQFRPAMLFGYPSSLSLIAQYAKKHNCDLTQLGIKVAFVTSERLFENQKSLIEEVFSCPVANGYGGRDAGFIAHACPHGGMHISAEDIIVEIVDPHGKVLPAGEIGEVVVTHLATQDFPFVRYRTGDLACLSTEVCPCGRHLPMLESIEGRTTDFVITADGTAMHALSLIYVLRELPSVTEFKIIQESRLHTRVLLVTDDTYSEACQSFIRNNFRKRLGDIQLDIERVDQIAREQSGKFKYVESKVGVSWDYA
ncbi:phenylacetate--CoA ligase family protein [Motilimonas pumila]|uniref:Phenylacetate--CoA ligase family protein n=1 Tax=Motilimonas pumila TaxID=2303987 RepID=A0A418YJ06_9GAMM|nr:phenylacetate--CoA ligase family protein [Motilimonas pumila]RJG50635.1 phenylacetate--CoA ligase family protein [Motilimonas pumila]